VNTLTAKLQQRITEDARNALLEDTGSGDLTAALVPAEQHARAHVIVREKAVICGAPWFNEVFLQLEPGVRINWQCTEGEYAAANSVVCELQGPAHAILTGERSALNFLQTLSATASTARVFVIAVAGTAATILDTRKTLPGLRLAQKYAVKTGGAQNHRIGLYDGILIKENHIVSSGGIKQAVAAALTARAGAEVLLEVEVESLAEARDAMQAGAERLLLDNFSQEDMRAAVQIRNQEFASITLEASGNVNLDTVKSIADTGVDFISIGALTKDIRATDFSMRFEIT
jgi:nicotinate-nucleotide pyrophosphorylase (carboxylating)